MRTAAEPVGELDRLHLARALELAERGRGRVSPNPLVGAVIVRDGQVLGEGWHAELGGDHAEVAAIADVRSRGGETEGATIYVTLEPCAHSGRTPPCTDAILAAGLARVVIASDDPSEKASGRGPRALAEAGLEVVVANGEEAEAARLVNQPFRKHARTGLPLVTFKVAASLDGRVATGSGDSRWISGERSRSLVHRWRAESDAIAVGIGTALADDPLLTARDTDPPAVRQPARVVFDSEARLPLESKLLASIDQAPLIVIAAPDAAPDRVSALRSAGADVLLRGLSPLSPSLAALGERGITSLFLEGGPTLAGAFLDEGEIDEVRLFIAPILIGGAESPAVFGGTGAERLAEATCAESIEWEAVGEDLLLRARVREW